jgi:hypothetical protein
MATCWSATQENDHAARRLVRRPGRRPVVLKIGTLDDPSVFGGAQMAIFTAEGQPFHLIADGPPAFEGLPPRQ